MPGSAVSSQGRSISSNGSRRGVTKNYRVVAHTSQVDESLFGGSHTENRRQEMLEDKWRNTGTGDHEIVIEKMASDRAARLSASKNKKNVVQVITKDLIRNLTVPAEDPSGQTMILTSDDYGRLKHLSNVLTKDELLDREDYFKSKKQADLDALYERKSHLKQKDLERRKNEKLNDLEEEQKQQADYMLAKAQEQRYEQEDEIKNLNQLCLEAKCHAIRDAQLLEKDIIKKEMTGEEKRLDQMMEIDRMNKIKIEEEIERQRKEECLIGAKKIMEQIQENEENRLLALEMKDLENIQMQKYIDKLCEEEAEKIKMKKAQQAKLRVDLTKANEEIQRANAAAIEQDRMQDEKLRKWQEEKAEREALYEQEQERIRIEKEKEVARLRALQERARDEQAERDFLRAKRAQEQAERDWRKKEAEDSRQKAENEEMLKAARARQMQQKEHFLSVQAQRERQEFERVLKAQREEIEREKEDANERHHRNRKHREDVLAQIRSKEQQRIQVRNNFFEEGDKLDEETRLRRQRLDDYKRTKLRQLKDAGIADKYVAQIERQTNVV